MQRGVSRNSIVVEKVGNHCRMGMGKSNEIGLQGFVVVLSSGYAGAKAVGAR
jgi:hypothetical protein